jgi:hypothetical protein
MRLRRLLILLMTIVAVIGAGLPQGHAQETLPPVDITKLKYEP